MLLIPRTRSLLGRCYEQEFWLARMQHQEVGIATDLVLQVSPLLPGLATISSDVHPDTRGDIHLVGFRGLITVRCTSSSIPGITRKVRPSSVLFKRPPCSMPTNRVCGSWGWNVDVLRVCDVGRRRETPPGHIHRPQGREFRPVAAEIVAIEQMRRFRAGINARASASRCTPGYRRRAA